MESYHLRYPIKPTKTRRHKRLLPLLLALLITVSGTGYAFLAIYKTPPILKISTLVQPIVGGENVVLSWPAAGQAAIGSLEEGVLAQTSATETPAPTASMAKVITALAVLQKRPIVANSNGATITLDQTDLDFYRYYKSIGGSNVPVMVGEQVTQTQALEAMMLPSANNMADSLAYWAFGSIDAYVKYANTMVREWGLTKTTIADAGGFSPDTVSTPSELIKLGQRLLSDPVLKAIVAKKQATIPVAGIINNTNILLSDDGIIGIKTGHTFEAGGCLLFAATHSISTGHDTTIIGVVQGIESPSASFTASRNLLASAKLGFGSITIAKAGSEVGSYTSEWGNHTDVIVAEDVIAYGWKGTKLQPIISLDTQKSPLTAGQNTGNITVKVDGAVFSSKLKIKNSINKPDVLWRLTHYF